MKEYKLCYLPLFEQDLLSIIDYISMTLHNPLAASKFVNTLENAILERLKNPLAFEPYPTHKAREHQYYRIYVDNYTAYYVIINDTVEMRRLLYSPRKHDSLVK